MSPQHKALLTAAFAALGPERVTRGLQATGHSWIDCFLAIATFGEPGAFVREVNNRSGRTGANDFASSLVGVPPGVVDEVVGLWDHEERRFRALATEWLELNRTAVPTGPVVGREQRPTAVAMPFAVLI